MRPTIKSFLLRGLIAGAAGGLAAALVIRILTETEIDKALGFEDATGLGLPPGDPAEFSRGTQVWGGMGAALIYGVALGLVFGVALAVVHHRILGRNGFQRAAKLALAGFVALTLIPALKYPPNPPAVGDPDTINERTTSYLLLMAASVVVVFLGWWFWSWLTARGWDGGARFLAGGGAFVAMVTVLMVVWPRNPDAINPPDSDAAPALEISADAPPEVLAALLESARVTDDGWIHDPAAPDRPLDLDAVSDPSRLAGAPAAVSTSRLVTTASYATMIWQFRLLAIGGLALMWAVLAGVFALLGERAERNRRAAAAEPLVTG